MKLKIFSSLIKLTALLIILIIGLLTILGCKKQEMMIKIGGSKEEETHMIKMIESFQTENPEYLGRVSFEVVSNIENKLSEAISQAPDLFTLTISQFENFYEKGYLYKIDNIEKLKNEVINSSLQAVSVNGQLYAYPYAFDTYLLYYDASIYTVDDVNSLEAILSKEVPLPIKTKIAFDIENGQYLASFFLTAGININDIKLIKSDDAVFAGNYLIDLVNHPGFKSLTDAQIIEGFQKRTLGAAFGDLSISDEVEQALGSNYKTTKLPTIKLTNDIPVNLKSLTNFKLYGINKTTKYPIDVKKIAEYLITKSAQQNLFDELNYIPTNLKLILDESFLIKHQELKAVTLQGIYGVGFPSRINDQFIPLSKQFGQELLTGHINKTNLQDKLEELVNHWQLGKS